MNDLPIHVDVPMESNDPLFWLQLLFFPFALVSPFRLKHYLPVSVRCTNSSVVDPSMALNNIAHREFSNLFAILMDRSQCLPLFIRGGKTANKDGRFLELPFLIDFETETSDEAICAQTYFRQSYGLLVLLCPVIQIVGPYKVFAVLLAEVELTNTKERLRLAEQYE